VLSDGNVYLESCVCVAHCNTFTFDVLSGFVCVDCLVEIAFNKTDICDRIVKHGGCLLDHFDLATVRPKLFCCI